MTAANLPAPLSPAETVVALYRGGLAPSSRRAYDAALTALARQEGLDTPAALLARIAALPPMDGKLLCMGIRDRLIAQGKSSSTTNLRLAALRKALAVAREAGVLSWEPSRRGLPKVKGVPVEDRSGPTEDEYRAMLKAATKPTERALLRLMGDGGLRVSEALSVRAVDVVRNAAGRITGVRAVRKGDDGSRSFCPVGAQTAGALEAALVGEANPEAPVVGRRSQTWARGVVRKMARRAGIKRRTSPHLLRHRLGRQARDVSGDVSAVSALLGHKGTDVAYAYYFDNKAEKAAELAEKAECRVDEG